MSKNLDKNQINILINFNTYNEYYKDLLMSILKKKNYIINDIEKYIKTNFNLDDYIKNILNIYNIKNISVDTIKRTINEDDIVNKILIRKFNLNKNHVVKYIVLMILYESYKKLNYDKTTYMHIKKDIDELENIIKYSDSIDKNISVKLIVNIINEQSNFSKNNYTCECLNNLKYAINL